MDDLFDNTLSLTQQLIALPSITPQDAGCQDIITKRLTKLGFDIHRFEINETQNLWAKHGAEQPLIVFAGHTDVVPIGDPDKWHSSPFQATIKDDILYGRGAADMKGSLSAMVCASEHFIQQFPNHVGSIGFMITSAEEGPSYDGTPHIVDYIKTRETIDYCIVGEPTADKHIGDVIKIGRRGSLTGKLTIHGKQGHIAYPHLADNAIHKALKALDNFIQQKWDNGHPDFPDTSLQLSNIHGGTGAGNVIPGALEVLFNFRYSPATTAEELIKQVTDLLECHHLSYDIDWTHFGEPFLSEPGKLIDSTTTVIQDITKLIPTLSTSGGTSDARYIAKICPQVIELGPCNATIHQDNECVSLKDLRHAGEIYYKLLSLLCNS